MGASGSKQNKTEQIAQQVGLTPEEISMVQGLPEKQKSAILQQIKQENTHFHQSSQQLVKKALQQSKKSPQSVEIPEQQQKALQDVPNEIIRLETEAQLAKLTVQHNKKLKGIIMGGASSASKGASKSASLCKAWKDNKKTNPKKPVNPVTGRVVTSGKPTSKLLNKVCKSKKSACSPSSPLKKGTTKKLIEKICKTLPKKSVKLGKKSVKLGKKSVKLGKKPAK
jgi:hypothetical protein